MIRYAMLGLTPAFTMATPAAAVEFYAKPRDFIVDISCDAVRTLKSKVEPVRVERGQRYAGRGIDRRNDARHAFIQVGDKSKWVPLACGHFADGDGALPGPVIPPKRKRSVVAMAVKR